jgi:hypothetical protein
MPHTHRRIITGIVAACALILSCVHLASASVYPESSWQPGAEVRYFDAHNHFTGILPYEAYANLPAFIASFSNTSKPVSDGDRLGLYTYLADVWYPTVGAALDDKLFSPPDGQRFALGARAAIVVYRDRASQDPVTLDGALERILTATPWSEFDSAYAFRGGPASAYLSTTFYGKDDSRLAADLCRATVLDLAATNIAISEQSLSFIGGWRFTNGRSDRLDTIECALNSASDAEVAGALHDMGKEAPIVKFVLMTHTAQLATLPGGGTYSEWSKTGQCAPVPLASGLVTTPDTIRNALLGRDDAGKPVVETGALAAFFDGVIGIDTAGPETTCFTPDCMAYYEALVKAVYDAAKKRRLAGWHGKLLVHTHVGEGAVIDYAPTAPGEPWTFQNTFAALPPTRSNSGQASTNVATLLGAVAEVERQYPDVRDYVIFRLAHDTWATDREAQEMHDLQVEADVNLESNVATGAYPISRMPEGSDRIVTEDVDPIVGDVDPNFRLNDLLGVLIPAPPSDDRVGEILGNASLQFLLEHHVRCLLGTDADGVEHSDIVKEYQYASDLVTYWGIRDPQFRRLASGVTAGTLFDNVRWHLNDMSVDAPLPY